MFELANKKRIYRVVWQERGRSRPIIRFILAHHDVSQEELMISLKSIFEKEGVTFISIQKAEDAWMV